MIDYIASKEAREDLIEILKGHVEQKQLDKLKYENLEKINKLYKYSSISCYTYDNIENNHLVANRPENFNDLFDSTIHKNTYSSRMKKLEEQKKYGKMLGYDNLLENVDYSYIKKNSEKIDRYGMTYLRQDLFISCLSETNNNNLMWSHYANENKGICIEYDFSDFKKNIIMFTYPVIYVDSPIDVIELLENEKNVELAILVSSICKHRDWMYENEWRVIFYIPFSNKNKKSKDILKFNVPDVKKIYLGKKFENSLNSETKQKDSQTENYKLLLEVIKKKNIELKVAKRQTRSYNIDFEEFDVDSLK